MSTAPDWQQISRMARLVDLIVTTEKDILKSDRISLREAINFWRCGSLWRWRMAMRWFGAIVDKLDQARCREHDTGDWAPRYFSTATARLIRDVNYLCRVEQIEVLAGVAEALRPCATYGLNGGGDEPVRGGARKMVSEAGLRIHRVAPRHAGAEGALLDAIYYCPHHPTEGIDGYRVACDCRKPKPR